MALLAATLLAGCETRVVDLRLPTTPGSSGVDAADPGAGKDAPVEAVVPLKCETVVRLDSSKCEICYSPEGMVVKSSCAQPPPVPDAGMPMVNPSACKVLPMDDTRCVLCPDPAGMLVMGCLKCSTPVRTAGQGDFCRTCAWSDLMAGQCLQCYTADGTSTLDDCDALRGAATGN
jgi:hypothetical protein